MKIYSCLLAAAMVMTCAADQKPLPEISEWKDMGSLNPTERERAKKFDRQLQTYLIAINALKPGHTREDILKLFDYQGGLSTVEQRTFIFRQCYLIKVDVVFELVYPKGDFREDPKDVIKTISAPYLGFLVID